MGTRLKWTAAARAEKNWPIYVLRTKPQTYHKGLIGTLITQSVWPWANENFSDEYMTFIMDRDSEALIAIADEKDAVRLRMWFDHPDVKFTRLKKQKRNANGH